MSKRIKVTGYISLSVLPEEYQDLNHETGLSEKGYLDIGEVVEYMEDIITEVVEE